ncbi:hypothetical protein GQ54DRAFT_336569, partial [Martensiomyces pterosporus]
THHTVHKCVWGSGASSHPEQGCQSHPRQYHHEPHKRQHHEPSRSGSPGHRRHLDQLPWLHLARQTALDIAL